MLLKCYKNPVHLHGLQASISKSWSVAFIITTLFLRHISDHIIYLFPIYLHYFQPLLPFYLFNSPLLSTLISFFIYLFLFFLFWLFLSPFYYYRYDILSHILYIFSHMKKVITLSLSLSLSLSHVFIFVWIFYFLYLYFRLMNLCVL